MKPTTVFKVAQVLTWIVFIGLCIQAGAMLVSFLVSLFIAPENYGKFYDTIQLTELHNRYPTQYIKVVSLLVSIAIAKAVLFYWLLKIFTTLNLQKPFSLPIARHIEQIGYVALVIAGAGVVLQGQVKGMLNKSLPVQELVNHTDPSSYLFMAAIIFVIAQVFKKGLELQDENELTV